MERTSPVEAVQFSAQRVHIEADGTRWVPIVIGRAREDGMWEAWIEFRADDGRPPRITDRETTQPNRRAVKYWTGGLEPVYFEGAFERARHLPSLQS
jgi:hypothetical protein